MGFESRPQRKKSIDEILAELNHTPEPNNLERTIDGVACKIFPTSNTTWNVYQGNTLFTVTKLHDGTFDASMQSMDDLTPSAVATGKNIAIQAVAAILS